MIPEPEPLGALALSYCYGHPDVATDFACATCGRAVCETCAFRVAAGTFCPDCVGALAAPDRSRSAQTFAFWSIAAAAGSVLAFAALMLLGRRAAAIPILPGIVGFAPLGLVLVGLMLGLTARAEARRTGSPLALIGTIASALLLAVYLMLAIIGLSSRS